MGLLRNNPMLAEMRREKSKALAPHNWRGAQLAARVLLAVVYLSVLAMLLNWIDEVEPVYLMYILLGLETVMIPAALHGTIAGERERRSFDLLLVAPVTPEQIVVGKFSRGFVTIMGLAIAIGLPALVIQLVKLSNDSYGSYYNNFERHGLTGFFLAFVYCITAGMAMGALTMWISSKTKTNSAAMLATIGALFTALAIVPFVAGIISFFTPSSAEFLVQTNPFVGLYFAYSGEQFGYNSTTDELFYTVLAMVIYMIATVFFLAMASKNVTEIAKGRIE